MDNTNFQTIHQMGNAINNVVRQAVGRDNVQNIDMDYVTVAQRKREVEETATGNPATFVTNYAGALDYLIAQITPVQDLHGYDNPWPEGGGKNLMPNITAVRTEGEAIWIGQTDNTTYPIHLEANQAYTISFTSNVTGAVYFKKSGGSTTRFGASGDTYTPSETMDVQMWVYATSGLTSVTNVQLEKGSSATSYMPYSNVCPISGWTGVNVTVSPTLNEEDGTTYSIVFPTSAGTVYGGTLTINEDGTGTLVVDCSATVLNNITNIHDSTKAGSTGKYVVYNLGENVKYNSETPTFIMENAKACVYSESGAEGTAFINARKTLNVYVSSDATAESVNNEYAGSKVVYELVTPFTYNLTALEVIETLMGVNNVWADTGDVTVRYKNYEEVI